MFKDLSLNFELMFDKGQDDLVLLKYLSKKKIPIMDVYIQLRLKYVLIYDDHVYT